MNFFLSGFIIAVIFARKGIAPPSECLDYVRCIACLAGGVVWIIPTKRLLLKKLFFGLSGIFWGVCNAGSTFIRYPAWGEVTAVSATSHQVGPILIEGQSQIYEGFGPQNVGLVGEIHSISSGSIFSNTKVIFQRAASSPKKVTFSWWDKLRLRAHHKIQSLLGHLQDRHKNLISGILFGTQTNLPDQLIRAFKRTGLYHLLVVSGLHVTLMSTLFGLILRLPMQICYAMRFVSPVAWRQISASLQVLSVMSAMLYLSLTGSSAAAQRSALFFGCSQLSRSFWGQRRLGQRLLWTAFLQVLIFPIGFVSEGTLMSWVAYLLLVGRWTSASQFSVWDRIFTALWIQIELMMLVTLIFGQFALISLVANFLFVSAFPVVVFCCLFLLSNPSILFLNMGLAFLDKYVELVCKLDELCTFWPFLSIEKNELPSWVRLIALGLSMIFVLNAFGRVSINSRGGR
jgi:predicted membrane metal-binding protein